MNDKVQILIDRGLQYSLNNPGEFASIYKEVYGEAICRYCPGIIQEKFLKLTSLTPETIQVMSERRFQIKHNKLIDTLMSPVPPQGQWTNANITDDVAIELIKLGYGNRFVGDPTIDDVQSEEERLKQEEERLAAAEAERLAKEEAKKEASLKATQETEAAEKLKEEERLKQEEEDQKETPKLTLEDYQELGFNTLTALANPYPKKEWKTMGKEALAQYLFDKQGK